jgi:hypothetical protein
MICKMYVRPGHSGKGLYKAPVGDFEQFYYKLYHTYCLYKPEAEFVISSDILFILLNVFLNNVCHEVSR